mgnify:CR=1 FL=1
MRVVLSLPKQDKIIFEIVNNLRKTLSEGGKVDDKRIGSILFYLDTLKGLSSLGGQEKAWIQTLEKELDQLKQKDKK